MSIRKNDIIRVRAGDQLGRIGLCLTAPFTDRESRTWVVVEWDKLELPVFPVPQLMRVEVLEFYKQGERNERKAG